MYILGASLTGNSKHDEINACTKNVQKMQYPIKKTGSTGSLYVQLIYNNEISY